jgi:hypothetical protein
LSSPILAEIRDRLTSRYPVVIKLVAALDMFMDTVHCTILTGTRFLRRSVTSVIKYHRDLPGAASEFRYRIEKLHMPYSSSKATFVCRSVVHRARDIADSGASAPRTHVSSPHQHRTLRSDEDHLLAKWAILPILRFMV